MVFSATKTTASAIGLKDLSFDAPSPSFKILIMGGLIFAWMRLVIRTLIGVNLLFMNLKIRFVVFSLVSTFLFQISSHKNTAPFQLATHYSSKLVVGSLR